MPDRAGLLGTTDGGVSGLIEAPHPLTALVAPTVAAEVNTIVRAIFPFACWRVDDMRFAFDSSAAQPDLRDDLANLLDLIRRTTAMPAAGGRHPLLSVFGHADPSGDAKYNKVLSGRRARSIYAILTRRVEIWERLADDPEGTNDRWGAATLQAMHMALGGSGPAPTAGAARRDLFRRYMDFLCHSDNPPGDLQVDPGEFLGHGLDPGGKADYQGCSEFNPVLLLSQRDETTLPSESRNERYSADRRVTVLLFRPGTRIDVTRWPCPRASEGSAACKKRFFVDHERRLRRDPDRERRFAETRDTFACRFYDRLATRSPCENPPPLTEGHAFLAVRVFFHARPMGGVQVRFSELTDGKSGAVLGDPVLTDDEGLAVFPRTVRIGNYVCEVEYQKPKLVCTVFDSERPEILVLPIGRPYLCIDGDVEFRGEQATV